MTNHDYIQSPGHMVRDIDMQQQTTCDPYNCCFGAQADTTRRLHDTPPQR